MVNIDAIQEFKPLVFPLLDPYLSEAEATEKLQAVNELLIQISGITGTQEGQEYLRDTPLDFGAAICTNEAAKCVLDIWRTVKFLQGIHGAILECQHKYPGQRIEILYAGCGPNALFLTLLAPLFGPEEIGFTLLEVNDASLRVAHSVIEELALNEYVDELLLQDAITYRVPKERAYHILLSETMDKALWNEAFVPILMNLQPQMPDDVVVIPANVIVGASLFPLSLSKDGSDLQPKDIKGLTGRELGVVFDLASKVNSPDAWPVTLPVEALGGDCFVALNTQVVIWRDIVLQPWESLITLPKIERLLAETTANQLEFDYPMKKLLGIRITAI